MLSALCCSAELAEIWVSPAEFLFATPERSDKAPVQRAKSPEEEPPDPSKESGKLP
jgi:hypothetical protein